MKQEQEQKQEEIKEILARPSREHFEGDYGHYQVCPTLDGNWSIKSELHNELSHSEYGAYNETVHCYFQSTKLVEKLRENKEIKILEVGFGAGLAYEFLRYFLYQEFKENLTDFSQYHIRYFGLEREREFISYRYSQVRNIQTPNDFGKNILELTILLGDAAGQDDSSTLENIEHESIDIIFQDPFCLKSNPDLWSEGWFTRLFKKSKKGGMMSTFSASTQVMEKMGQAGWAVERGVPFNRKKGHLIAKKI